MSLMVFSLAIGMFSFVVASIYVSFEYNRNSNHKDADRVYRLMVELQKNGRSTYLPYAFASELKNNHPEIEAVSLVDGVGSDLYLTANKEDYLLEQKAYFANQDFFKVFTFPLKYGEVKRFNNVNSVVISEKLGDGLFNGQNPVGEILTIHGVGDFQVVGVMQKIPDESLLDPGLIINRSFYHQAVPEAINYEVNFTYAKVKEGVSLEHLKEKLFTSFARMYCEKYPNRFSGIFSEPLSKAYWGTSISDFPGGVNNSSVFGANKQRINRIGYLGIGILICGIVGFLSLSLGLSHKRAKEIGVRKVNGARQLDIQRQLLSEALFYSFTALLLVLIGLELTGVYFTQLFGVPIHMDYSKPNMVLELIAFTIITGMLAGTYPAFIISKLNPVRVLSGKISTPNSSFDLKRLLSVIQLSLAVLLVFATLVQFQQSKTMMGFDLGYDKENLLALRLERDSKASSNQVALMDGVNRLEEVSSISGGPFPFSINGYRSFRYDRGDTLIEGEIGQVYVGENYFEFMGIDIVEGRSFAINSKQIGNVCIVNQAMADFLGGNVVGKVIDYGGVQREIVGISRDYTDWGVAQPKADPRVFIMDNNYHSILIRYSGKNKANLISAVEGLWRSYDNIVLPSVVDLESKKEASIRKIEKHTTLGAFLSIMILVLSLLNLLGYSVMYANAKVKAISIRKILGAEALELFVRLVKPFFYNLTISLLIALPIAYWLMEQYLRDYAVRMSLGASEGIVVGGVMAILVLFVVGFQLLRVSKVNPVVVLKAE